MFSSFHNATYRGEVDISYCHGGSGPPLLLLHGYPQNKYLWMHVAPRLAREFHVVCADLRGYGESGKPDSTALAAYSFRAMARDQRELMQGLGFDRFKVAGHDRGGRTAWRMAMDHPCEVEALALLDIVPTSAMFDELNAEIAATYWHWFFLQLPFPFPENLIAPQADMYFDKLLSGLGGNGARARDEDQIRAYRRSWSDPQFVRASCADYRATALYDRQMDAQDKSHLLACPTLVMWGESSPLAKLFDVQGLWRSRLSNMTCRTVPAGHFLVDEQPERVAAELSRFFRGA